MRIFEVINFKKRELTRELSKENPDPFKIKRLKESIERHKRELEKINKGKKRRRNKFKDKDRERRDKNFRRRFMRG